MKIATREETRQVIVAVAGTVLALVFVYLACVVWLGWMW